MSERDDVRFMQRALALGRLGLGRTSPNPPVGCVLVRDGEVIGEGFHQRAGLAHAEIEALNTVTQATGATAYVTLEPCNHRGRTGPCTEALIEAGVSRVVVGAMDPNPDVGGGGVERLRAAGLEVVTGVEEAECKALIAHFTHQKRTGRPLVTLKVATTLDGKIATSTGHSRWVTGPDSRMDVHELRNTQDAILVGTGTLRADDPLLTTRLADGTGRNPLRVIVTTSADLPAEAKVLNGDLQANTLVITGKESAGSRRLRKAGCTVWTAGLDAAGQVALDAAMELLSGNDCMSVLVEGGQQIATAMLQVRLVDRVRCYIAPSIVGGDGVGWAGPLGIRTMSSSIGLQDVTVRRLGDDICIEGACVYRDR